MKVYNYTISAAIGLLILTVLWVVSALSDTKGLPQTDGQSGIGIMLLVYARLSILVATIAIISVQVLVAIIRKNSFSDKHFVVNSGLLAGLLIAHLILF